MTLEGEQSERGPSQRFERTSGEVFMSSTGGGPPDEVMARMMRAQGPLAADTQMRQAVSHVWQLLPADSRDVDLLETRVRGLVDRILAEVREDAAAFGFE
jgi:hypothetical protein